MIKGKAWMYFFGIIGIIMVVMGCIQFEKILNDISIFGMLSLLFSLHLGNESEISKIKEELKNE